MASVNARSDFQETRLPGFAFPAVRGIGINGQAFVVVADFDEHIEVIGAHGRGAGMDFVSQENAKRAGVLAHRSGLFHEALLAFLDQVIISALPETPGITGGQFPSVGYAPEHRNHFHTELCA